MVRAINSSIRVGGHAELVTDSLISPAVVPSIPGLVLGQGSLHISQDPPHLVVYGKQYKDLPLGSSSVKWSSNKTLQPVVAHQTENLIWFCQNCIRLEPQAWTSLSEDTWGRWYFSNTSGYWISNHPHCASCSWIWTLISIGAPFVAAPQANTLPHYWTGRDSNHHGLQQPNDNRERRLHIGFAPIHMPLDGTMSRLGRHHHGEVSMRWGAFW